MVTASLFKSHFEAADDSIRERLEIQFRMHPQIMSMINHFYENRLSCGLKDPTHKELTISLSKTKRVFLLFRKTTMCFG
jgi:superfamily I DNA and/or RNA helicase